MADEGQGGRTQREPERRPEGPGLAPTGPERAGPSSARGRGGAARGGDGRAASGGPPPSGPAGGDAGALAAATALAAAAVARPEWEGTLLGTWADTPLVAKRRQGEPLPSPELATTLAKGLGAAAAVVEEPPGWAVYTLDVEGFGRADTEVLPGTDRAAVTSLEVVEALVTEDGTPLLPAGPGRHLLQHVQAEPLRPDVEDPAADWLELHGEGLPGLDGEALVATVHAAMRDRALFALRRSEEAARAARTATEAHLGAPGGVERTELARVRAVAQDLAALAPLAEEARSAARARPPSGRRDPTAWDPDTAPEEQGRQAAQARLERLEARRQGLLDRAPVLGHLDPEAVASASDEELLLALGGAAAEVLAAIEATRARVLDDRLQLWTAPGLLASTEASLGIADPERLELLREHARRARRRELLGSVGLAALSIGLGLSAGGAVALGAAPWAAAVLSGGAAVVGVLDQLAASEDLRSRRDAAHSDLDPRQALVPDDLRGEELLLWVGWIGLGLDAADVVGAVRLLRRGRSLEEVAEEVAKASGHEAEELVGAGRKAGWKAERGADGGAEASAREARGGMEAPVERRDGAEVEAPREGGDRAEVERPTEASGGLHPLDEDALELVGRPLEDVRGTPAFEENYLVDRNDVVRRRPGRAEEVPQLRLEEGRLVRAEGRPATALPPGATGGELRALLAGRSQAFVRYREALGRCLGLGDGEVESLLAELAGRGARDTDALRHAFHEATRERLLDWTMEAEDAATAHGRLLEATADLNPSYQGSLAERWYRRFRARFGEPLAELEPHPRLRPEDNPAMEAGLQVPDSMDLAGRELGEVKSTSKGLSGSEVDRLRDILDALDNQGVLRLQRPGGGVAEATSVRLTFTNPEGALGSVRDLRKLLADHEGLVVEVFDARGGIHLLGPGEAASADFGQLLRTLTEAL